MKIIISSLLALCICASVSYAKEAGPNVGVTMLSVPYGQEQTDLKMALWHPTYDQAKKVMGGPFLLDVARDAKPAAGRRGLIVISHGSQGSHFGHNDTAMYLASKGYIVLTVLHPHDNYQDHRDSRQPANWINRPRHIKAAIDAVLENKTFAPLIDPKTIGVIGYSAGGYTALALSGGIPNTKNIAEHCAKQEVDAVFCAGSGMVSRLLGVFSSRSGNPDGVIENTRDPRIKAAVLMAPLGVLFNDADALKDVQIPIRIYRAEKDEAVRYPYHAEMIRQKLPESPEYVVVNNAGHYAFLAPFPEKAKQRLGEIAADPPGFDRNAFHRKLNREIESFFNASFSR